MLYSIGDRVRWPGLNRHYTGEVVGYRGPFALVRVDGSGRHILLQNEDYVIKPLNGNEK